MNKFSKIVENNDHPNYYKVRAEIDLIVKASNDGEASYKSDMILSSVVGQSSYNIKNIIKSTKEEFSLVESYGYEFEDEQKKEYTDEEIILKTWDAEFGDRTPTTTEKLEFYRNLRNSGIDGILIQNTLKDKLKLK